MHQPTRSTTVSFLRSSWGAAFGLALLGAPALADGLDRSHVPADARAVVHIDLDALQKTHVFQEFRKRAGAEFDAQIEEARQELGVDPLKVFHSVTVVSPTVQEGSGTVIVRGSRAIDDLLARFQQEDEYSQIAVDGLTLHSWGGGGYSDDWNGPVAYVHSVPGSDERVIVLSNRAPLVVQTVHVLQGKAPSLKRADQPALKANPKPGTIAYVEVAERLDGMANFEPVSRVAKMMRAFQLQVGENNGRLFLSAILETANGADATKIGDIVTGAKALVSLATGGEVPLLAQDLLDALKSKIDFRRRQRFQPCQPF